MSATYVQRGDAIDYTPGADLVAGDVVAVEDLIGVAKIDVKAGELGALAVTGIFEFPKATGAGNSIAFGKKVVFDPTAKEAKPSPGDPGDIHLGKCVQAVGEPDTTVLVRLEQ